MNTKSWKEQLQTAKYNERKALIEAFRKCFENEKHFLKVHTKEDFFQRLCHFPVAVRELKNSKRERLKFVALKSKKPSRLRRRYGKDIKEADVPAYLNELCVFAKKILEAMEREKLYTIFVLLRRAFAHPLYQAAKENETLPIIHFFHSFAISSFSEASLMTVFEKFSKDLWKCSKGLMGFEKRFALAYKEAEKEGFISQDVSFRYITRHPLHAVRALSSLSWGKKIAGLICEPYDPRGKLENIGGVFFDERFSNNNCEMICRSLITPSPTVGDDVALEAKAFLQALENRQFFSEKELKKDPYPYVAWNYCNIQNLLSASEGVRARALLELEYEYPLSFRAISVSMDNGFWKNAEGKLKKSDVTQFKKALLLRSHFSIEGSSSKQSYGYYFNLPKEEIEKSIEKSASLTESKGVFYLLATLGLIRLNLRSFVQELNERLSYKQIHFLSSIACKECMDRGGIMNSALLWALGDKKDDERRIFSLLFSRALLSRSRLVQKKRLPPLLKLIDEKSRKEIHAFFTMIGSYET